MRKKTNLVLLIGALVTLIFVLFWINSYRRISLSPYPGGKNFAFTITDDPDNTRLEKIKPVYAFLTELGVRNTIAVWVKKASRKNGLPDIEGDFDYGDTLERGAYRDYIIELKKRGFEIAMHTASGGNDLRKDTLESYEEFKKILGDYPKINIMHSYNLENVYGGSKIFKNQFISRIFKDFFGYFYRKAKHPFNGEDSESPYFWGDILKEKTKYVRLWGTSDINTLKFNPSMPYHDSYTHYINYWFSYSDGHVLNRLLSDQNIRKLSRERGASIVYTHLSSHFIINFSDGKYSLNPIVKAQLIKLARQKDGWFVSVSELLDRLLLMKNVTLFETSSAIIVANLNTTLVPAATILVRPSFAFYDRDGKTIYPNSEGEIIIGDLAPGSSTVLYKSKVLLAKDITPGWYERISFILNRTLLWMRLHFLKSKYTSLERFCVNI